MNDELSINSFFDELKNGKLIGAKCSNCGEIIVPPRYICSNCGCNKLEKITLSGEGTLESYTVVYIAPKKFENSAPYIIGVIKLKEGPKICGRIIGVDPSIHEEKLKIGVKMVYDVNHKDMLSFKLSS